MDETTSSDHLIDLTAEIIIAHVSNTQVANDDIARLIADVHGALKAAADGPNTQPEPEVVKPEAAVTARKSLANPDHILSMIDGKPYKTLKRHIGGHGYTPESYREAFGLAHDYPMVAPTYSAQRGEMAKQIGLGRNPAQKRGRKKKA